MHPILFFVLGFFAVEGISSTTTYLVEKRTASPSDPRNLSDVLVRNINKDRRVYLNNSAVIPKTLTIRCGEGNDTKVVTVENLRNLDLSILFSNESLKSLVTEGSECFGKPSLILESFEVESSGGSPEEFKTNKRTSEQKFDDNLVSETTLNCEYTEKPRVFIPSTKVCEKAKPLCVANAQCEVQLVNPDKTVKLNGSSPDKGWLPETTVFCFALSNQVCPNAAKCSSEPDVGFMYFSETNKDSDPREVDKGFKSRRNEHIQHIVE